MSEKLKRYILLIVLIIINLALIVITSISVVKTISHVFKTGGVSSTDNVANADQNPQEGNTADNKDNVNDNSNQNNSKAEIMLEPVSNGVRILANNEQKIDYISYSLDNGEMQKIQVNETQYEKIIELSRGQHILKIELVDINKVKTTKEDVVVGDMEPTVNVELKTVNGKSAFSIDIEDDENIVSIRMVHNGGQDQIINVNAKTYHHEIIMTENQTNTLIVEATNINGISKTRRIKFDNK